MENTENGLTNVTNEEIKNIDKKPTENVEQTTNIIEENDKINDNNNEEKKEKNVEKEKIEEKVEEGKEKVEEKVEEEGKEKSKEKVEENIKEKVEEKVAKEVEEEGKEKVEENIKGKVEEKVANEVEEEGKEKVEEKIEEKVEEKVVEEVEEVEEESKEKVEEKIEEKIEEKVAEEVEEEGKEKVEEKIEEKVEEKVAEEVEEEGKEKVEEKIEEKKKEKGKEKVEEEEEEEENIKINLTNEKNNTESSGSSSNKVKEAIEETKVLSDTKVNNNESKEVKEENIYKLKIIEKRNEYQGIIQQKNIITQNINGPCPLLALCNILILRGDISIPIKKREITYEEILDILGDYIARNTGNNDNNNNNEDNEENNFQDVWDIIPTLKKGLDINVKFDSVQSFEPSPALTVFKFFNIKLLHGWTVDPDDKETYKIIVEECGSYNKVVEKIIESDSACNSKDNLNNNNNDDDENQESINAKREELYHAGMVCKNFIESTASQLTYHGLTSIPDILSVNEPTAFFRNNHFLTLIKTPDNNMYTLVTDQGFVNEKNIVWESLSTIDGDSFFVDGLFNKYKNKSSNNNNNNPGDDLMLNTPNEDLDYALALSLQEDEKDEMIKRIRKEEKRKYEHNNNHHNHNNSNKNHHQNHNNRQNSRRNSNKLNNKDSNTNKSKTKESDDDKCIIM